MAVIEADQVLDPRGFIEKLGILRRKPVFTSKIIPAALKRAIGDDDFTKVYGTTVHEVVERGYGFTREQQRKSRQRIEATYVSSSGKKRAEARESLEKSVQLDGRAMKLNLAMLAANIDAGLKYNQGIVKRDEISGDTFLFDVTSYTRTIDATKIADISRPALRRICLDEDFQTKTAFVEVALIVPITVAGQKRVWASKLDFLSIHGSQKKPQISVYELKTYNPRCVDVKVPALQSFAVMLMGLAFAVGVDWVVHPHYPEAKMAISRANFEDLVLMPGVYDPILCVHPDVEPGQTLNVAFNGEEIDSGKELFVRGMEALL